jgi:hypothetical protein
MKAIKLLMAIAVIGLVGSTCSLGQQCSGCAEKAESVVEDPFSVEFDSMISSLEGGWPTWNGEFDFGDDLVWQSSETQKNEPTKDAGPGEAGSAVPSEVSIDDSSEDVSDDSSDGYVPDDWIVDEGFYSDYGGSEGEEFGWAETDDHPGMPGPEENALWIVFPYSNNVRTTRLLIQKDRYAKELIIPGTSGTLTIYEDGPNGVKTYVPGWYVKARRAYRTWFTADSVGNYTVWYEVHDEKFNVTNRSNVIEYRVFENLAVVVPNEAKCPNETATLRALASGCENPSYQWYRGNSTAMGTPINNATSSSYIIWSVQDGDEGYYTCNVTCNGNSVEDAGWLYVGWWDCNGISPCKCQFRQNNDEMS